MIVCLQQGAENQTLKAQSSESCYLSLLLRLRHEAVHTHSHARRHTLIGFYNNHRLTMLFHYPGDGLSVFIQGACFMYVWVCVRAPASCNVCKPAPPIREALFICSRGVQKRINK